MKISKFLEQLITNCKRFIKLQTKKVSCSHLAWILTPNATFLDIFGTKNILSSVLYPVAPSQNPANTSKDFCYQSNQESLSSLAQYHYVRSSSASPDIKQRRFENKDSLYYGVGTEIIDCL